MVEVDLARREAEKWFVDHGLPYFVDDLRDGVRARLGRGRLVGVGAAALVLGAVSGVAAGLVSGYSAIGFTTSLSVALAVALTYSLQALNVWVIARWALRRTFSSLGMLLPLATRALPMLLLFMTFLFINTEVWQVASRLDGGVLGGAVLVFGVVGVGFLLTRLDEELDDFDDDITAEDVLEHCRGMPFGREVVEAAARQPKLAAAAQVTGLQKANLVLMLLVAQAVQVLLLVLAVFLFFLVFGAVAIDDDVITLWIIEKPSYPFGIHLVSRELIQVSTFLASFSGLYFTVYAVTDEAYRKEFFTAIMRELGEVVSARVVYRSLQD